MNAIIYYDVDETLFTHDPEHAASVRVLDKNGEPVTRLSNHDFLNKRPIDPEHSYDYSEFRCSERFIKSAIPIKTMVDRMRSDWFRGCKVEMLTARGDMDKKADLVEFFANLGIFIDGYPHIHLHRAGNHGYDSPSKNKYIHITNEIKTHGYDHITMYDDNDKMREVMQQLSKEHSITTIFNHMLPPYEDGKFETFTFHNGELI